MVGKGGGAKIQFCVPLKSGLICWGYSLVNHSFNVNIGESFMEGEGGCLDGWVCQTLLAKSFVYLLCVCGGYIAATSLEWIFFTPILRLPLQNKDLYFFASYDGFK
jgi:hypothetical protein